MSATEYRAVRREDEAELMARAAAAAAAAIARSALRDVRGSREMSVSAERGTEVMGH